MAEPIIAQKGPYEVELDKGEYWWCRCGGSKNQPFCDDTHLVEAVFEPVMFEVTKTRKLLLCGCKHTTHPPYCDNTHKTL